MIVRIVTILRNLVGRRNGSGLTQAGREYLSHARAGASSRVLQSGRLTTPSRYQYPSTKMGVYIRYESLAEAGFIQLCEASPEVTEYYSQGPGFKYRYRGAKGKLIWASTIPDFVVVEAIQSRVRRKRYDTTLIQTMIRGRLEIATPTFMTDSQENASGSCRWACFSLVTLDIRPYARPLQ